MAIRVGCVEERPGVEKMWKTTDDAIYMAVRALRNVENSLSRSPV